MANESNERECVLRAAAALVACSVFPSGDGNHTRLKDAMLSALTLVDRRPDVATAEHDERTRDLESLVAERDAAMAERDRQILRSDRLLDESDGARAARATAEANQRQAITELEKARAMLDDLREQLAAPTVHSAAVANWLCLHENRRKAIVDGCRTRREGWGNVDWDFAADVLDSLSMQAPAVPAEDDRAAVPTDAADEAERLRGEIEETRRISDGHRVTIRALRDALQLLASVAS